VIVMAAAGAALAVSVLFGGAADAKSGPAAGTLPAGVTACGNDWPAFSCDLANTAYSTLDQIDTKNVSKLQKVWQDSFEASTFPWNSENEPIVVSGTGKNLPLASGTMFLGTDTGFRAIDPATGKVLWSYQGPTHDPVTADAARVTIRSPRTQAYGDGLVFDGQQDRTIVALDAKTGKLVWKNDLAAIGTYGSLSNAESDPITTFIPSGKNGVLISAANGGDAAYRGYIDAFDPKSGALLWHLDLTPGPQDLPFILTWANPAEAASGGVADWVPPAFDPKLGLLYFGTGNAYPETSRASGKNLFSDSEIAVSVKTGKIKWYYQTTHHDEWDYDCPTPPVLFNDNENGKLVRGIAWGCKNGYYYVRNRVDGGPLPNFPIKETPIPDVSEGAGAALNSSYPTQPIPQGGMGQLQDHCPTAAEVASAVPSYPLAPDGLKIIPTCPYAAPSADQYVAWGAGAVNYPRSSYDPSTNDIYICQYGNSLQVTANKSPVSTVFKTVRGSYTTWTGGVAALNASTNKMDWFVRYNQNPDGTCNTGTMSTAGGLVFAGSTGDASLANTLPAGTATGGFIYAFDAKTGKKLWSWQAPGTIKAPAITYMVDGHQYVTEYVMNSKPFPKGEPDLLTTFALPGTPKGSTTPAKGGTSPGAPTKAGTEPLIGNPTDGASVFKSSGCGSCHTLKAAGATGTAGPDLDTLGATQAAIVSQVTSGGQEMPAFGGSLSAQQIKDVASYVYQSASSD
jgi:quinohemoprotein ethanol dehydrogenase